ncbi:MAG: TauD/TfdA family dioxygenase, partial [Bacteroidota bacterium]
MKKIQRRSRAHSTVQEMEVKKFFFDEQSKLPRVFQAMYPGLNLENWINRNRDLIQSDLNQYGAILFRNFSNTSIADFDQVVRSWKPDLLDYDFGSTPRQNLQEGIFTST